MKKSARTRWDRNTESVDDYLKAIYSLTGDERRWVGGSELASRLEVAPASVTNMLQKLSSQPKSLVDYKRGEGVRLSSAGRRRALEIVRHHRLIETFLFEVLGYPIQELHDEAERLEHFISESFEERVATKLGNPIVDPHGHCIPSMDGAMPPSHGVTCKCGL
jgi:DtxR family Mn-dependent transcriptional regulator